MRGRVVFAAVLLALLLPAGGAFPQAQLIDVVRLRDGRVLEGLVVDQVPGVSVKVATVEREVLTFFDSEIETIEKREVAERIPVQYADVVFLKDGVIFRGLIVEQVPAESIRLRTANGLLLDFEIADVWKIAKEEQGPGGPPSGERPRDPQEGGKIQLTLEITRKALSEREAQRETSELKEEIENLERQQERFDQENVDLSREAQRQKIEQANEEIKKIVEELLEGLEECGAREESEASVRGAQAVLCLLAAAGGADEAAGDLAKRLTSRIGEVVRGAVARLPTEAEVNALEQRQKARAELQSLLGSGTWKAKENRKKTVDLAAQLSAEQRRLLYEAYRRRDQALGVGLNAIPVLHLGSWAQKDWLGVLIGYAQSAALIAGGLSIYFANAENMIVESRYGYYGISTLPVNAWGWVGGAFLPASYLLGFVPPFLAVSRWNRQLAETLGVDAKSNQDQRPSASWRFLSPYLAAAPERGIQVGVNLVSAGY